MIRLRFWRRDRRDSEAVRMWKALKEKAEQSDADRAANPEGYALAREFQDAALRADGERLADIVDQVLEGIPVGLFNLTRNERLVVDAYVAARRSDA